MHAEIAAVLAGERQWCVVTGDCLEVLPTLPAGCVDAVVTDPPYGVEFGYDTHDDSRSRYLKLIPRWHAAFPCKAAAVTPGIVNVGYWPPARWVLAWMKTNSMGASYLSGPKAVSRNLWEPVLWYGSYPKHPPSRDIIHAPIDPGDKIGHPCPKPLPLMLPLVRMAASVGDIILDPFCGSGTTGVACLQTGRRFIGIEISPAYADLARRRLEAAERDERSKLFPAREAQPEQAELFGEGQP